MWMYFLLFFLLQAGTWAIRLVSIHIPERVNAGSGVRLSCVYDLEGDQLYNIKWYLDGVEFFRFVPLDKQTKLFFPVKGIQVDLEKSGNETVFIQDVKTNTSGTYSCEISADAPSFHTLMAERMMAVEDFQELPDTDGSSACLRPSSYFLLIVILGCLQVYYMTNLSMFLPGFHKETEYDD